MLIQKSFCSYWEQRCSRSHLHVRTLTRGRTSNLTSLASRSIPIQTWSIRGAWQPRQMAQMASFGLATTARVFQHSTIRMAQPCSLVVTIPTAKQNRGTGNPTGVVSNTTQSFPVTKNGTSLPARFIFVSEDGSISGWNPTLDGTHAIIAVDNGTNHGVNSAV